MTTTADAAPSTLDLAAVIAALQRVPGVEAAGLASAGDVDERPISRNTPDGRDGSRPELRLDLETDADEGVVALAVGTLLRERFGVGVDGDHFRLIEHAARIEGTSGAPEVEELRVVTSSRTCRAVVSLRARGVVVQGDAESAATGPGVARAVAEATLHAVEELTEDRIIGSVDAVVLPDADNPAPRVEVVLLLDIEGVEHPASGGASVGIDSRQAIARAVLNAVAEHLTDHLTEHLTGHLTD